MSLKKLRSMPKVSIIIPVLNGSNFLRQAIDSALAQTYSNIEIIVVNDGSTDSGATEAIAKSYGEKIQYFSKPNGGCASALNFGILQMQGDLFSWLSHDDLYRPKKVERQVAKYLAQNNPNSIIFSGYVIRDERNRRLGSSIAHRYLSPEQLAKPLYPLLRGLVHGCTLLIPRHLFEQIAYFNEQLRTTQDYALWFDLFRQVPLIYDQHVNVIARTHSEQDTQKINAIHLQEGNALWAGFAQKLSVQEMIDLDGSELQFLSNLRDYLAITPFTEARISIDQMVEQCKSKLNVNDLRNNPAVEQGGSTATTSTLDTPPIHKPQNFADYEGVIVKRIKYYIPAFIWSTVTLLYRAIRNSVSAIFRILGIFAAITFMQRKYRELKMRYELYRDENLT